MKCSTAKELMLNRSEGQTLDPRKQKALGDHLAQCSSCEEWQEYLLVIEKGPDDLQMPTFSLSPQVRRAIQETPSEGSAVVKTRFRFQFFHPIPVALAAALILFICLSLILLRNRWSNGSVEWIAFEGKDYQIVKFDSSESLDLAHLKLPDTPALRGTVSRQLAFLTRPLAIALGEVDKSFDWDAVREALAAQEVDFLVKHPKFLVLSRSLTDALEAGSEDTEIWVTQPTPSIIIFTLRGEGR